MAFDFAIMTLALTLLNTALIFAYMRRLDIAVALHVGGGLVFVWAAIKFVMMVW